MEEAVSDRMEGNATRPRAEGENERLVDLLRQHQLEKLAENEHKGHWGNESPRWLLQRARQELEEELQKALERWSTLLHFAWSDPGERGYVHVSQEELAAAARDVARECADVANFVAMIADNALRGETS